MKIFKKKAKLTASVVGPDIEAKQTMAAACGFKYKDRIYNTAQEANHAFQKEKIRSLFIVELAAETAANATCSGYFRGSPYEMSISIISNNWSAICALAAEKLEMK